MSEHRFHDVGDMMTCGTCLREWCGLCTPTPAGRCPFEYEHDEPDDETPQRDEIAQALQDWANVDETSLGELFTMGEVLADLVERLSRC